MTERILTKAVRRSLAIVFNPVSWVAFLSPVVLTINLLYTRNYAIPSDDNLVKLIDDPLFRAVLDYRTQFTTVIIALVFYMVDNVRGYHAIMKDRIIGDFWKVLDGSIAQLLNLVACVLLLGIALYVAFSGQIATPQVINYYLRPAGALEIGLIPPMESPLTWARALLIVAGFASASAFSKHD